MNLERKRPSQKVRVLRVLTAVGARGVCARDFLPPSPCDGYGPITRLGARIHELRQDGHVIREAGLRDGFRVYRLEREAWQPIQPPTPAPEPAPAEPALIPDQPSQAESRPLAGTPYDPWSEAA